MFVSGHRAPALRLLLETAFPIFVDVPRISLGFGTVWEGGDPSDLFKRFIDAENRVPISVLLMDKGLRRAALKLAGEEGRSLARAFDYLQKAAEENEDLAVTHLPRTMGSRLDCIDLLREKGYLAADDSGCTRIAIHVIEIFNVAA
eukprot:s1040_g1.t1